MITVKLQFDEKIQKESYNINSNLRTPQIVTHENNYVDRI